MLDIERENRLIGTIYDASMNSALWSNVLEEIVDYTESKTAIFTVCDQLNPKFDFTFSHNIPEEGLRAYADEQIKVIDMKLHTPHWQGVGLGGAVKQDFTSYATMLGTDEYIFYEKCLKPTGISHVCAVLLEQAKYQWAVLATHRAPTATPFEQTQLDILARLGVHLRRALQIHRQFSEVKQENQNLSSLLDYIRVGVIILDQDSRLIYTNKQAQDLIETTSHISIDRFNRLKVNVRDQATLDKYILSAMLQSHIVNLENEQIGGVMSLTDEFDQKPMLISVVPFSMLKNHVGKNVGDQVSTRLPSHQVAIFLTSSQPQVHLAKSYLMKNFKLSKREVEICEHFVQGLDFAQISTECGMTLSTVRTYFKHIFAKVDCNSQAELMRILLSYSSSFQHIH
jgi:DNA-binding NarL/FixJ family response regulator